MIRELKTDEELNGAVDVMRRAFATVAEEFNFTEENAPTNAAFMTFDRLRESSSRGVRLFGVFTDGKLAGTVALERSPDNGEVFYLERLAVVPEQRHLKLGRALLDFAFNMARDEGGKKISIGTIDENSRLKKWYLDYGFVEVCVRRYEHLPFSVCFMEKTVDADKLDA
ncbi:MAG TPA: GNAT family N-acetyltransferase [Spirochaetota bacterium]|nr:GNAT family N-acetyltransferase [Spirochaetota bacterium]